MAERNQLLMRKLIRLNMPRLRFIKETKSSQILQAITKKAMITLVQLEI
jgi:hypothetical protein